jgi:5-(carboxyamino)imidazole ribonucleotide synthase
MLVGILGGGQLGRMLVLAGTPLGLRFRFLEPGPNAPTSVVAHQIVGDYDGPRALERFCAGVDVVTYEFENVPIASVQQLLPHCSVYPPPAALETAQDRLNEKQLFRRLRIPTAPFMPLDSRDELDAAIERIELPAVLKTRRMGYDGKGQRVLRTAEDVAAAWDALGGVPLLLEGLIDFTRELSIIGVRDQQGNTVFYPLAENAHQNGILVRSLAPAPDVPGSLQTRAEIYAMQVMDALDYVGVLSIELFQAGDRLLANEIAPRVHNSGHWSIEGAETSQFENHIRAIAGMPLGSTLPIGYSAMVNLIGTTPDPAQVLDIPGAHLHLYDKAPRPGRKLGHITLRANEPETVAARLHELEARLQRGTPGA